MKKINYFQILKDAAGIVLKNRFLWWFGFLILLSSGTGILSFNENKSGKNEIDFQKIWGFAINHQEIVISAVVLAIIIFVIFFILGIVGRGALIKSVQKISKGKSSDFKEGFAEGKKYFWKLFFISLLTIFFTSASLLVFALPLAFLFTGKSYILGAIFLLLAIIILVPVLFLISFARIYGCFYGVMFDLSIWESLENAYNLVIDNIFVTIIMSLVFLLAKVIISIAIFSILIFLAIPLILVGLILYFLFKTAGLIVVTVFGSVVAIIFLVIISSIIKTFYQTAWILFFKEIAKEKKPREISETEKEISPAGVSKIPA